MVQRGDFIVATAYVPCGPRHSLIYACEWGFWVCWKLSAAEQIKPDCCLRLLWSPFYWLRGLCPVLLRSTTPLHQCPGTLHFHCHCDSHFHGCLFCESCSPRRHWRWDSDEHIYDSYHWRNVDVHSAQIKWCWFYSFWNFISVVRFNVLSPFLIGRMFLCKPRWKYSAKLVGSELGQLFFPNLIGSIHQSYIRVQKASLNMFWEHSPYWTIIASDWLRAELSCGWRKNKNKNGWQCC